jgi:hypothetical protein|tara:strand:+ start:103 stop:891 length:789 start_codon:yes stop_codon:yes gene_type:complete
MKENYLTYIIMHLSDEYQDSPVLNGFTHLADSTDPLHILMSLTNLITAVTLVLCTLKLGSLDKNDTISQLPLVITLSISLAMLVGLIIEYLLKGDKELVRGIRSKIKYFQVIIFFWMWSLWGLNRMNYFDLSEWSFMILISVTLLTTFIILEVYHRIKLGRIEINQSSLLNRVKSSSKKIPTILTGAEIEEIRLTSTQINNQLLTFMGYITVGLIAALLINIVNLDSGLITSFTTSIISVDVALLFSNIVASNKKPIIEKLN